MDADKIIHLIGLVVEVARIAMAAVELANRLTRLKKTQHRKHNSQDNAHVANELLTTERRQHPNTNRQLEDDN